MISFNEQLKMTLLWLGAPIIAALLFSAQFFPSKYWQIKYWSADRPSEQYVQSQLPLFETPAWKDAPLGILLIQIGENEHSLLLRLRYPNDEGTTLIEGAVYRYDPQKIELSRVPERIWHRAKGSMIECSSQVEPPSEILRVDKGSERLLASDRQVAIAGNIPLKMVASPSRDKVAVVSAEGSRKEDFFFGVSSASGQHYHQVFSLPDVQPLGKPTPLPMGAEDQAISPCWSPGERYVIYTDALFSQLSVIPVQTSQ